MANTDDEHTKEKIDYNKRDYEKEIKAIYKRVAADLDRVRAQYINANRQISLHSSEQIEKIITDGNFDSAMNSRLGELITPHFVFKCFEEYRKEKERRGERVYLDYSGDI
jgi:hypothetical protein